MRHYQVYTAEIMYDVMHTDVRLCNSGEITYGRDWQLVILFLVLGLVAWESNLIDVSACNTLQQSNITKASHTAGAAAANGEMSKDALHIGP